MILKPINTAPRDGSPVFLYWPGCDAMPKASWQCFEGGEEDGTGFVFMWSLEDDRLGFEGDGWLGYEDDPEPTHWMPVP